MKLRRRHFLRASTFSLVLPALESLGGAKDLEDSAHIKRLFLMTDGYGFYTPNFYPSATGANFPSNDVIKSLDPLREHVSILGGLSHLNGHGSMKLVASGTASSPNFGDSLDQSVARRVSDGVPLDSLLMATRPQPTGGSYRNKIPVSMMYDSEEIFDYLFTKGDIDARGKQLREKQSMLDLCLDEARALSKKVSASDKQRLDEYFNSIRETEKIVKKNVRFLNQPQIDPGITKGDIVAMPTNSGTKDDYFAYIRSHMRFVRLAFKFDLTRVAYLWEHGRNHGMTHHGRRPGPIAGLTQYARQTVETIAEMLTEFRDTKMPAGGSLLDETLFVWTAALGSAAAHKGVNCPAIIAGGKLGHHGRYTHYQEEQKLTRLYLSVMQKMGIEADHFNDGNQALNL